MGSVALDFPHRRAGHCGSGALRDLLEYHRLSWDGAPLGEGMVFGLGGGLGFFFVELPEMDPPLYLVGRTAGLERDLCSHLGVALDLRRTDDPDEGWRWVRDAVDAGRPVMVNADIGELDYLRVRLHNTMHDIVVCGYDEQEGVALVADNDRDELQRCSLESLALARASGAFPGPHHHATWLMDFPADLPDAREAVGRGLARAADNMRTGGEGLGGAPRDAGLAGVAAFAAAYPAWEERPAARLASALRGLWVFVVKAGTGGAMFRSLQADFLADAARLLGNGDLREAAGVYRELALEWRALADAVAGPDAPDAPAAAHAAGLPHVEAIARLEVAGIEAMEAFAP